MAVSVTTGPNFTFESPETLFTGNYLSVNDTAAVKDSPGVKYLDYLNTWDISPDGRFLMLKKADANSKAPRQFIVLENWFKDLKQRGAAAIILLSK